MVAAVASAAPTSPYVPLPGAAGVVAAGAAERPKFAPALVVGLVSTTLA
jgi:hypothetical protein